MRALILIEETASAGGSSVLLGALASAGLVSGARSTER
jgi:hypothetical protein